MKHSTRNTLCIFASLLAMCACGTKAERDRKEAEVEGAKYLGMARNSLHANRYDEARDYVETLRLEYPLAFDARRQAILTLDSIELGASRDSVRYAKGEEWERLKLKVQFFERKLKEDIKSYGNTHDNQ